MSRSLVAIGLVRDGGRFFLQRRDPRHEVLPGLWEFPGGKIDSGEDPGAALARELREELDWVAGGLEALAPITHSYPDREVVLHPFLCEESGRPRTSLAWGWFTLDEMRHLPIPEANHALLESLATMQRSDPKSKIANRPSKI